MNTIIDYLSKSVVTMYENNIKLHFVEYVERYINVVWKKKLFTQKIRKIYSTKKAAQKQINKMCYQLRKIKVDVLEVDEEVPYKSYSVYHTWIDNIKTQILPNRKFKKDSLYYDIQCSPQDYLPFMMKMMMELESQELKINNVFPQRSEIIPKHIPIDTASLIYILRRRKDHGSQNKFTRNGNLVKRQDEIWKFFFRTERQCFRKKGYSFHHMIHTDGVSCKTRSVRLMIRNDQIGKFKPKQKPDEKPKSIPYISSLNQT